MLVLLYFSLKNKTDIIYFREHGRTRCIYSTDVRNEISANVSSIVESASAAWIQAPTH